MGDGHAARHPIRNGWIRVSVCVGLIAAGLYSPGCGGQVLDVNGHGDGPDASGPGDGSGSAPSGFSGASGSGGASGVAGRGGKGGSRPTPGAGGASQKPVCGDGIREVPESCDGNDLGGATCAAATMGAYPNGVLSCTKACDWDMTRCSRSGGTTSADNCFDQNGVPATSGTGGVSSGSCAYGSAATALCDRDAIPPTGEQCVLSCGCSSCPGSFTRCSEDAYCAPIFACAIRAGCRNLAECETACGPLIKNAEAAGAQRLHYADLAVSCYMASCSYPCPVPPPIGR